MTGHPEKNNYPWNEADWSPEEQDAFERWLSEGRHEDLLRQWNASEDMQRDLIRLQYLESRREKNLKRFVENMERRGRRSVRGRFWWAAAAAIAVLLAWGTYSWLGNGRSQVPDYIATDYASSSLTIVPSMEYKLDRNHASVEIGGIRIHMDADKIVYAPSASGVKQMKVADSLLYHELVVPRGRMCEVELIDGTRVKLNADSRLRYPITFRDSLTRTVYLDGEAYFDVRTDSLRPFIVKTSNVETRAYGTKFNVKAYAKDLRARVMLEEGQINVVGRDRVVRTLSPGDYVAYDHAGLREYERGVDASEVTCWQDYRFFFKNEMLMFIATDLERKYDVNIYFDSYKASIFRFYSRTHRCEHLEDVLDLLRYTQKIDYRVEGRNIYISLHE